MVDTFTMEVSDSRYARQLLKFFDRTNTDDLGGQQSVNYYSYRRGALTSCISSLAHRGMGVPQ